jgi:hypothetical protein
MALLHRADLRPSKMDLLAAWAPTQPWFDGEVTAEVVNVSSYRFDDPDGEVGIETILVRAGAGRVMQVPLTYRAAPLDGGEKWLIGTTEHSVLGTRWVYDATGDPVYLAGVATAARTGAEQAEQWVDHDGELVFREPNAVVKGSGTLAAFVDPPAMGEVRTRDDTEVTISDAGGFVVTVVRHPAEFDGVLSGHTLTGTWVGQVEPTLLVAVG